MDVDSMDYMALSSSYRSFDHNIGYFLIFQI